MNWGKKANGNIIRSRAEWKEKGERSTKLLFFFNLEKANYMKTDIKILQRNGIEIRNQMEIMNIILDHFQSIYSFHKVGLSDSKFSISLRSLGFRTLIILCWKNP